MFGLIRRIRELEAERVKLRTALTYYARKDNWMRHATHQPGQPREWIKASVSHDRGALARRALAASAGPVRVSRLRRLIERQRRARLPSFLSESIDARQIGATKD